MAEDVAQPTQMMPAAGATQIGGTLACPVCRMANTSLATYCSECGFLLASTPGEAPEEEQGDASGLELVETRSGRRFALRPGANLVGREGADVLLMDTTVSRRHASIDVSADGVSVTDAGSTNGTRVDGAPIAPGQAAPLQPGMVVAFGSAALALVDAGGAIPTGVPAHAAEPAAAGDAAAQEAEPGAGPPATATRRLAPIAGTAPVIYLTPGKLTVGRRPSNDVAIAGDSFVSGAHADLISDELGASVVDLHSTNGTMVNGLPLQPGQRYALAVGDQVQMGQCVWRFEAVEAEAQETPPEDGGEEQPDGQPSAAPEMPGEEA